MGTIRRLVDVVRSNITALVERAEDPTKMSNQVLYDMRRDIGNAKGQLANLKGQEKLLKRKADDLQEKIENRDKQIKDVVAGITEENQAERDQLASELIADKQGMEQALGELTTQHADIKETVDELEPAVRELEKRFADFKRKRDKLVAEHQTAKAEKTIYDTLGGIGKLGSERYGTLERMEEKVQSQRAHASASKEMATSPMDLDSRFSGLNKASVENELARYKANNAE